MADNRCVIRECKDCKPHDFQDKTYGSKKRVMGLTAGGGWRCTVCSKVHGGGGAVKKK